MYNVTIDYLYDALLSFIARKVSFQKNEKYFKNEVFVRGNKYLKII